MTRWGMLWGRYPHGGIYYKPDTIGGVCIERLRPEGTFVHTDYIPYLCIMQKERYFKIMLELVQEYIFDLEANPTGGTELAEAREVLEFIKTLKSGYETM
jgi:hypothetical protein